MFSRFADRYIADAFQRMTNPYCRWRYKDEHRKRVQFEFQSNHEGVYQALCAIRQVHTERLLIVPEKYHAWLLQAGYPRNAYRGNFTEKTLEHYLTVELLGFKPTDVVIDIASRNSPFVDIIERTVGCQIYEQDIIYPPGINGRRIGGNAAHIPLPDHSVDKMTLHCSFEHFEGTADGDFIRECGRLLVPGGQCAIVPLYISERCFHLTNPGCLVRHGLNFDADTPVIRDPLWAGSRFARFYDVESFNRRIVPHLGDSLEANVYFVENEKAVDQSCYVKFILLLANH